jgi:hypothetical protein
MIAIAFLFVRMLCDCSKLRRRLKAEILVLRHQFNVLQQRQYQPGDQCGLCNFLRERPDALFVGGDPFFIS